MPANTETSKTKRRTQVKDLPRPKKQLSKKEQQKVKGGDASTDHEIESVRFKAGKELR